MDVNISNGVIADRIHKSKRLVVDVGAPPAMRASIRSLVLHHGRVLVRRRNLLNSLKVLATVVGDIS